MNLIISEYQDEPLNEEQDRLHHESALKFHGCLADFANNALLGFIIKFMAQMLTEVTVNRELFRPTNYKLWKMGLDFHKDLLIALKVGLIIFSTILASNSLFISPDGQYAPIPPVFLPLSPSPTLLWS